MWRAARYGLQGTLASPRTTVPRVAADVVAELLNYLRAGLEAHGDWHEVSALVAKIMCRGNGASRQRVAFARRQDPSDVMAWTRSATVPAGTDV